MSSSLRDVISDAGNLTEGTLPDARLAESSVLQHTEKVQYIVTPDDDWQSVIDNAYDSLNPNRSGIVRAKAGSEFNLYTFNNTSLPITLKPGVVLDIRGAYLSPRSNASHFIELRGDSQIIGHGAAFFSTDLTGSVFYVDGDATDRVQSGQPAQIVGYPRIQGNTQSAVIEMTESSGGSISNMYAEVGGQNAPQLINIKTDGGGFINNNVVKAVGSIAAGSDSVIKMHGTNGTIRGNKIVFNGCQIKGGDHFWEVLRGFENVVSGSVADFFNVTNVEFFFGASAKPQNQFDGVYFNFMSTSKVTNNSGEVQIIKSTGDGMIPQDLSGVTGGWVGQTITDDGTNTAGSGLPCIWTGSAWQPTDGSATFT